MRRSGLGNRGPASVRGTLLVALLAVAHTALPAQRQDAGTVPRPGAVTADSGPRDPIRRTTECVVTHVTDGDTLDCRGLGRVRLIGIDAPETSQKPFGATSTAALNALLPVGTRAQLELDVETHDQYGRTLGYVWSNGRMVNWLLVRNGWAVLLTVPPNVQYVNDLRAGQQRAHAEQLGLWRVGGFDCLPADHRRKRC